MRRDFRFLTAAAGLLISISASDAACAQTQGGVLRVAHRDSPASMSTLEEVTISTVAPMMAVFNNLVIFDQHVPQNTLRSIVPDLATSWLWNEDGTELTFRLREGVRWHDGQPFTAKDVQCTWDMLLGRSAAKFRINPRKSWYWNLDRVTTNGDHEAIFHLKQPQPASDRAARFRLFAGLSLPCAAAGHAPASDRHRPVQIRLVQAERVDPADPQPGLLEAGPALSRRHRMDDHPQPLDGAARLRRGQARHDLSVRGDRPAVEGHREPGSAGDLRVAADEVSAAR